MCQNSVFSCDQAVLWTDPSVRLSHLFRSVPVIVSSWNFQEWLPLTKVMSMQKVQVTEVKRNFAPAWAFEMAMKHRRGALLFFKFIPLIPRWHGLKNCWFWPELSFSGQYSNSSLNSQTVRKWCTIQGQMGWKIDNFALIWAFPYDNSNFNSQMAMKSHIASRSMEEISYYFSRSSIQFQGHMGWKIDDSDLIWARLQGWLQLSNPSDFPCLCFGPFSQNAFILWPWNLVYRHIRGAFRCI